MRLRARLQARFALQRHAGHVELLRGDLLQLDGVARRDAEARAWPMPAWASCNRPMCSRCLAIRCPKARAPPTRRWTARRASAAPSMRWWRCCVGRCADGVLLLALEDLHWAEPPTLTLLARVAAGCQNLPCFVGRDDAAAVREPRHGAAHVCRGAAGADPGPESAGLGRSAAAGAAPGRRRCRALGTALRGTCRWPFAVPGAAAAFGRRGLARRAAGLDPVAGAGAARPAGERRQAGRAGGLGSGPALRARRLACVDRRAAPGATGRSGPAAP